MAKDKEQWVRATVIGTLMRAPFKIGVEEADGAGENEGNDSDNQAAGDQEVDDDEKVIYKVQVSLENEDKE